MADLRKIILSRTDNIGDVVLTLPLAGYLKKLDPTITIYFIGKKYTAPIIESCIFVDHFLDREEVLQNPQLLKSLETDAIVHVFPDKPIAKAAYKASIPIRIGTSHRLHHWLYCNKLINLSRKNSDWHETLLNFELLKPLKVPVKVALEDVPSLFGMEVKSFFEDNLLAIDPSKVNLIFHPKSKGSAREWPLEYFKELALLLPPEKFKIFITGTETEGNAIRGLDKSLLNLNHIHDVTGLLSLSQLISFINACDALVACSTGPLHIAAALGRHAYGIYPPMRPIHAGRWAPLGNKARVFSLNKECSDCRNSSNCPCIEAILPEEIASEILKLHE